MKLFKTTIISLSIIVVGSILLVLNFSEDYRNIIKDEITSRGYQPSSEVQNSAKSLSLTKYSDRLLRASRTQFDDAQQFNTSCADLTYNQESSRLLGCYANNKIYVYDITNPELENSEKVTLAHELLHAGWQRLSSKEKLKIKDKLNQQLSSGISEDTQKAIQVYKDRNLSEENLANEIHSILATDEPNLSPELENYYSKFFKDRKVIASLNLSVVSVFKDVEKQMESHKNNLDHLGTKIDEVQNKIKLNNSEYDRLVAVANAKLDAGDYSGYNALVGPINAIVSTNQSLDTSQQELISSYNTNVAEFNKLIEKYNLLNDSLDSRSAEKVKIK
jgi:uncharacterized protein YdcH (DUF465 family)